jgi:hypothetical protein
MHDDSVLVAIEAALAHPAYCECGDNLTIRIHGNAAWLECASLGRPSRFPRPIAGFVRSLHQRRLVAELPEAESLAA